MPGGGGGGVLPSIGEYVYLSCSVVFTVAKTFTLSFVVFVFFVVVFGGFQPQFAHFLPTRQPGF